METLTPVESEPVSKPTGVSPELADAGINFKNLTFLSHLNLKDEMMNPEVMEKVQFLSDRLELDELEDLDMRLGFDDTPRIDKLFGYIKLLDVENDILKKRELIRNQKESYESN